MAYANATRFMQMGFSDRFAAIVGMVKEVIGRRSVFLRTFDVLQGLSGRDLSRPGLSRSSLASGARGAVYGA